MIVHSHRGLNHVAPENTLAAFEAAARMGASWIETDVDIIRDGTPIIMHDSRTDRTTDRSGSIYDLSLEDLEAIDAGSWFSERYAGERIPTLRQLVSLLNERGLNMNLELKANSQGKARSLALVEAVLDELERCAPTVTVMISSFSVSLLTEVHRRSDAYDLAWLVGRGMVGEDWRSVMELCGATYVHPSEAVVESPEIVERIRAAGFGVNVWTVNDRQKANQLRNWGCTGVITDVADVITGSSNIR